VSFSHKLQSLDSFSLSFDWEHIVSQSTHLIISSIVSMYVFNGENILDLKWMYLTWKKENFGGAYLSMGHVYSFISILDLRNQFEKENHHIYYVLCYMTNKIYRQLFKKVASMILKTIVLEIKIFSPNYSFDHCIL